MTPDGGARGETTVTVTASEPNSAKARRKLGTITVRHPANKDGYPVEVYQRPAVATQTLLLYMPGRSLIDYYERNIEGVSAAVTNQIPGDGRILVCYQPEKHSSAVLQEIRYDPATERCERTTLKTYDGFNAGNPEKVRQLFADAAELAPAQNYGLIIGCHGKAWILALVPILRAGMGMLDGMLTLLPAAKVGFIGLYRDETTLQPVEYFCKLPQDIAERDVLVLDPMLATGGSAIDAITQIKKHGAKRIKFIGLIAAPEGIKALHEAHPDVRTLSYRT